MNDQDKQRAEFEQVKKDISSLKYQISQTQKEKEESYQALKSFKEKIDARLKNMRELKDARNQLTAEVKKLKKERDSLNKAVKEKSSVQKSYDEKLRELRSGDNEDPRKLKSQIDRMEEELETEVMSYQKEQGKRKLLKELNRFHF